MDVFIPAYEEADVIEQAIRSTVNSAYPNELLQVTVLTEHDDDATNKVVSELLTTYDFVHRIVPSEYPGTPNKPRALNYGFEFSDAAVVGVVDAEDVVDDGLIRAAAVEVSAGPWLSAVSETPKREPRRLESGRGSLTARRGTRSHSRGRLRVVPR